MLVPVDVFMTGANITQAVMATPVVQVAAAEWENSSTANSYKNNYERAIARGIINRPSGVEDEYQAIDLANRAIDEGDRYEAAVRFAQALAIIEQKDGAKEASDFERSLDKRIQQLRGQTLRKYLPMYARIFPDNPAPINATSYRANYEKAIARGIITRPSTVDDEDEAIELARQAIRSGDRDEAAIRFAQALVIVSEKGKNGPFMALAFERRLDAEMLEQRRQTLRGFLPLFGRIFPERTSDYNPKSTAMR
jgi:hypothetical protein